MYMYVSKKVHLFFFPSANDLQPRGKINESMNPSLTNVLAIKDTDYCSNTINIFFLRSHNRENRYPQSYYCN